MCPLFDYEYGHTDMMLRNKLALITLALMSHYAAAQSTHDRAYTTLATPTPLSQVGFVKSQHDDRSYGEMRLDNGLRVVVVSDPSVAESAVSLSVGVGQFHDPENYQGLAHFLEHMIFQGSESYPTPNTLKDLIAKHNGHYNAMTEAQLTTYFFTISSAQFDTALTMLSDAIAAPLFKKENIDKELTAIEQEWQRLRQQDMFVVNRTLANTVNPEHPIKQLGVGNKATLQNKTGHGQLSLYKAMQDFYQKYYSSNIMTLTLVGDQSIDELKKLAKKHFAQLPNREVADPRITLPVFTQDTLNKEIKLKTKVAADLLMLQFPLQNNFTTWQYKPNAYLNMLLSSHEPGSLAAKLIEQELVHMVLPMLSPNAYGSEGTALIQFQLTEKGKKNKDKIIAAFFDYVALLKQEGINEGYSAELKQQLQGLFNDYQKPSALQLARQFSRMMHSVPAKDILHFDTYFSGFNAKVINQVLNNFTLDKARIWHVSGNEKVDTQLSYADGGYQVASLSKKDKTVYAAGSGLKFNLHEPEIDAAQHDVQIITQSDKPKQLHDGKGVRAWLKTSKHFTQKQGVIAISLESPKLNQDLKSHTLTNLLSLMMLKDLQRLGVRAQQRHQTNLMLLQTSNGNLAINIAGKTAKHGYYAQKLFQAMADVEFKESRFNSAKKLYSKNLSNLDKLPLIQQSELYFGQLVKTEAMHWSPQEIIAQLETVTLSDVKAMHKQLLTATYVDLFAFGQYGEDEIKTIANSVRSVLGDTSQVNKPRYLDEYKPVKGSALNKKVTTPFDNTYLRESYIYPQESLPVLSALKVINQLFNNAIFKTLRTEKQMAYVVGSRAFRVHEFPAFSVFMESADASLKEIKSEFDNFIVGFYSGLEQVSEQDITTVRQGLIKELKKKPENIFVESQPYFSDWQKGNYQFDSRARYEQALEKLNKQQVLDVYKQVLLEYQSETVLLQLKGDDSKGGYFEFSK